MTAAMFYLFAAAAAVWIIVVGRSAGSDASLRWRSLAWQLGALSFIDLPASLRTDRTADISAAILIMLATAAILVDNHQRRRWRLAYAPWMAFYSLVLLTSSALSSAPADAIVRSGRAVALMFMFSQIAAELPLPALRRLFSQFIIGCAAAVVIGVIVAPSEALVAIRAPVIRVELTTPILGLHATWTGLIGLCLIAVSLSRRPIGWLGVIGAATGSTILVLAQKRSFWLAAVVSLLVWIFLRHRQRFVPAMLVVTLVAAMFATVGPLRDLWDREQSRPIVENITTIRRGIFDASIEQFLERPVIGDGLGVGNHDLLIDVGQQGRPWGGHDELGSVLAANGILGLLAVSWGYLVGFVAAVRAWRETNDAMPLVVAWGSLSLVPLLQVLQQPLFVAIPYLTFVIPAYRWRYIDPARLAPRIRVRSDGRSRESIDGGTGG